MPAQNVKLSLKTKLGFGVCDLGGNLFFTVIAFWMPMFLTDVVGLAAGLMGAAVLVGRLWDAVTDPMIGFLSDRTVSKWGRRRPYIFWGSFPLFVTMIIMFTAPGFTNQTTLFIWATAALCLLATAYTLVNIPYSALTPDLTSDFDERTVLNGYRMSFAVVGTILGAGAAMPIVNAFSSRRVGFSVMGGIFGFVMMATALITFFTIKEPVRDRTAGKVSMFGSYLSALKNVPFRLILIPWTLFITGVTVISGMVGYYFTYIYEQPAMSSLALLELLVISLVSIPVWVKISRRIGKKMSYAAGMLILAVSIMGFFFIGHYDMAYAFVLMVFAGIGLSTHYVMPYALVPDVIEYDYAETGVRKEGVYYGMWTFISKLGQALASAIIGWILAGFGYVANQIQSDTARLGIRLLIGPIPAVIFVIGIVVILFYPIDEKRYRSILAKIARNEAENAPPV